MLNATDIIDITKGVTKTWTKVRKAEERGRSRARRAYVYSDRVNFTDVAARTLPSAYQHASGGGRYTVSKRQLYYACRQQFHEQTGRELEYSYFANTLLVQYLNRHPETSAWKITADPRGTLVIPNAAHEVRIPCGTIQIENYLESASRLTSPMEINAGLPRVWPSLAGGQRYQAVLYIEKEGFGPVLDEAQIAERFDLAVLCCKGQSVVAARQLVDQVCYAGGGVPLFVVHNFDKAGFEISQRLTRVSDWAEESDRVTYRFKNEIDVTDLGLRLTDVQRYALAEESYEFKGGFATDSICTPEEKELLRSGRRVELNAFTSPQFIEWLGGALMQHLPKRLIPDDGVLTDAYRRALAVAAINRTVRQTQEKAVRKYADAPVPETLRRQLQELMDQTQDGAWDAALYRIAETRVDAS